jgi:16S rRNA G966 N2-methylase RsmD
MQEERPTHTNADMSHQNTVSFQVKKIVDSLKNNGIGPTINRIYQQGYYKAKGVDFSTENIFDLTLTGEHKDNGTALVSTSKEFFSRIFKELEEVVGHKVDKNLFIDYGSGKGAAIIHAKNYGFNKTIGIEFAKELHEVSLENIKKLGIENVDSRYEDATEFIPPNDISIIYFFNPFDEVVMEKVIQNIVQAKDNFNGDVYVIYGNPSCSHILDDNFEVLNKVTHESGARVNYYKV